MSRHSSPDTATAKRHETDNGRSSPSGNRQDTSQQEQREQEQFALDSRRVALAGVAAAALVLLGLLVINMTSGSDARQLLDGLLPVIRSLSGGIMTATTTILALMLTMLSMTNSSVDARFNSTFYARIRQLALADTVVFVAGVMLLMATSLPLTDARLANIPESFYQYIYIGLMVGAALVTGGIVAVTLLLYNAIAGVMRAMHPQKESELTQG